jgi:hypothetical protein
MPSHSEAPTVKRGRGRPRGSKNSKTIETEAIAKSSYKKPFRNPLGYRVKEKTKKKPQSPYMEDNKAAFDPSHVKTQAERVITKFGGVARLLALFEAMGCPRTKKTVYNWLWPKSKKSGTGGIIPAHNWPDILNAARLEGVILTPEDMDPRPKEYLITSLGVTKFKEQI